MKKKQKRFINWEPKVGEMALVPGVPANAWFVDALRQEAGDIT